VLIAIQKQKRGVIQIMLANEIYVCPFCAYKGNFIEFIIKKDSGEYSKKTFQCPDCQQMMRRNTLIKNITPREWGIWLYSSIRVWSNPREKFYDRLKKKPDGSFVFADRIKTMGIADEFWEGWKEAKEYGSTNWKRVVDNAYISDKTQTKLGEVKRILDK